MNKILIIINTGMPGLQRLAAFFIAERIFSTQVLGQFATDYSIIQLLSFYTAIGWCGLVMIRAPQMPINDAYQLANAAIHQTHKHLIIYAFILLALYKLEIIANLLGSLLFLGAWTQYQIARHLHIAIKHHKTIVVADAVSLTLTITLMASDINPLISLAISFFIASLILSHKIYKNNNQKIRISIEDKTKTLEISTTNFLLGAAIYGLPIIISMRAGYEYSALVGYLMSFIIIIQITPRAFSAYYLPKMAKNAATPEAASVFPSYSKMNALLTLTLFSAAFMAFQFGKYINAVNIISIEYSDSIFVGLLVFSSATAISVPASDFLLTKEESRWLMLSTVTYLGVSFFGYSAYYLHNSNINYTPNLIWYLAIINCIRTLVLFLKAAEIAR